VTSEPRVSCVFICHDGGGKILLARRSAGARDEPGAWDTGAGALEFGETFEAAVAREVAEEVGLRVTDIRYVGSQPWPFPQSLMLGFVARAEDAGDLVLDPDEIEEARWFTRDELRSGNGPRALPPPVSIARHILDRWVAGEFS
jgi:NAD+ diphosphatase